MNPTVLIIHLDVHSGANARDAVVRNMMKSELTNHPTVKLTEHSLLVYQEEATSAATLCFAFLRFPLLCSSATFSDAPTVLRVTLCCV